MSVEPVVPAGMKPAAAEQAQERHVFFLRKVWLSDCGWWRVDVYIYGSSGRPAVGLGSVEQFAGQAFSAAPHSKWRH